MDVKSEQGVIKKRGVMRDEGQWHPTPFRSKNKKTTPLSDRHAHSKNDFFFTPSHTTPLKQAINLARPLNPPVQHGRGGRFKHGADTFRRFGTRLGKQHAIVRRQRRPFLGRHDAVAL